MKKIAFLCACALLIFGASLTPRAVLADPGPPGHTHGDMKEASQRDITRAKEKRDRAKAREARQKQLEARRQKWIGGSRNSERSESTRQVYRGNDSRSGGVGQRMYGGY